MSSRELHPSFAVLFLCLTIYSTNKRYFYGKIYHIRRCLLLFPKVNQSIVINIKNENQSCRSIVAEVGEKEILISAPLDKNMIGLLPDGTLLDVTFIAGEHKYKFHTEIIGRKKENILLFRLTKPQQKEIIKVQYRENFRVNTNLRLVLNENELNTINISVGGLLFSSGVDLQLQKGDEIAGTLFIPNIINKELEAITFQGHIKRVTLINNEERKNVAVGFTKINQRDQMKITQYCFEKQRQLRLKERETK
jgi:c-di-GMP-binding flagellar brake protein YcgR